MTGMIGKRNKIDYGKQAMVWVINGLMLQTRAARTQYAVSSHHYPHRVIYSSSNFNTNSREKDRRNNKD